jgi:DNA primase large subunit
MQDLSCKFLGSFITLFSSLYIQKYHSSFSQVLRKLEQLETHRVPPNQASPKIEQLIKQQDLNDPNIDSYSHFILRLSYCQTEELRRWFMRFECKLFQHRLLQLSQTQLAASVKSYASLAPISKEQKESLMPLLLQFYNPTEAATMTLYAVPFTQALELVAKRQVIVQRGKVYVPDSKVYPILVAKFRMELSKSLALLSHTSMASEETRIRPLLQNLHQCLAEPEPSVMDGSTHGVALTATTVASLQSHMPLCMRQLQTGLEQDRHLRHWGRLQYGLFLKGAGLSLDDSMAFFQRHFTKVTGEQFQKQYGYNIRHMFGKEGKRATYTPYSCSKIILGNAAPAHGEHHGCPYKHYDVDHLGRTLQKLKIGTQQDRSAIVKLKQEGQFQLACLKQFQVQHPKAMERNNMSLDNVGNHPNAWFRASLEYSKDGVALSTLEAAGNASEAASPSSLPVEQSFLMDDEDDLAFAAMVEVSPEKL